MKAVMDFLKRIRLTPEKAAVRLLSVYALLGTISIWCSQVPYTQADFFANLKLPSLFLGLLFGFLFLCLALFPCRTMKADKTILFIAVFFYLLVTNFSTNNTWYFILSGLLALCLCIYCLHGSTLFLLRFRRSFVFGLTAALGLIFILYVGGLTALRYKMYVAPNYDFGIFSQMFEYMKKTGIPYTTCERDKLLSHFNVHLSFIYYLILPFYLLFSTPMILNIMQAVILASGLIPLVLLCRQHKLSDTLTAAISVVYTFYPALSAGCFYDIHENCFLTPLILWLLLSIDKDSNIGLILTAILICSVKEDAPNYLMFIAIYMAFAKKKILKPAILFVFSLTWFLLAVVYLKKYGDGVMLYRYANFSTKGGSIQDVIKACLMNPGYVFSQCLNSEKAAYVFQILLPLGFLPLVTVKMHRYILLGPFLLINLMSYYPYQHSLDFQYNFGVAAILFYLTILNLSELKEEKRKIIALSMVLISIFGASAFVGERTNYLSYYKKSKPIVEEIDRILETSVPEDASVSASTFLMPHLYKNKILYQLNTESPDMTGRTEYIVIDLRFSEYASLYPVYENAGYEVIAYAQSAVAVLCYPQR